MRPFASLLVAAARSGAPARLFPANSVLTSHIRHFGVMDTLRAQLEKKKESKINDKKRECAFPHLFAT